MGKQHLLFDRAELPRGRAVLSYISVSRATLQPSCKEFDMMGKHAALRGGGQGCRWFCLQHSDGFGATHRRLLDLDDHTWSRMELALDQLVHWNKKVNVVLRLECSECKYKSHAALARAKHFEL